MLLQSPSQPSLLISYINNWHLKVFYFLPTIASPVLCATRLNQSTKTALIISPRHSLSPPNHTISRTQYRLRNRNIIHPTPLFRLRRRTPSKHLAIAEASMLALFYYAPLRLCEDGLLITEERQMPKIPCARDISMHGSNHGMISV